jgi:hypothetical protein
MFRDGGSDSSDDDDFGSDEVREDDAHGIGGAADDALQGARNRLDRGRRGDAGRVRTDEPVVMPGGHPAEDQEREDDAAGEAALCAQSGKGSHVRREACDIAANGASGPVNLLKRPLV